MTLQHSTADASDFTAVDQSPDPSAMIVMMDSLRTLQQTARSVLLDRLGLEDALTVLDVGCGTGDDLIEMSGRLPPGAQLEGVDVSQAMIDEARRRTAAAGIDATFRVASALDLPYPDAAVAVCRMKTVLIHVSDPGQAIREIVRVTRPGGRVGVLELDEGSIVLDHPDQQVTRTILDAICEARVQPLIGRQLYRLFREAGLTDVTADPIAIHAPYELIRAQFGHLVTRLCDQGVLSTGQADDWWSYLAHQAEADAFTCTATTFVVTGTRPLHVAGT